MINFFLLNAAINLTNLNAFKNGMSELMLIEKVEDHQFRKHHSIWNLPIFLQLFNQYGQAEQAIIGYLEQLSSCENYIQNEQDAIFFFGNSINAFLGIAFGGTGISIEKQITNKESYERWCYSQLTNIEKLKKELISFSISKNFEKSFDNLHHNAQASIIEEFKKARKRNLKTPYFPDTKIIKDVTKESHKCKVLELRVYSPVALRVYFNETNGITNIADVEQKSNPNQDDDINQAYKILKSILNIQD